MRLTILVLSLVLAMSACGGDDGPTDSGNSAPPIVPPPLQPVYEGNFVVTWSSFIPDGNCTSPLMDLPTLYTITITGSKFLMLVSATDTVVADGSWTAQTLNGKGAGSIVRERPYSGCQWTFGFSANITYTDEDNFSGTIKFVRSTESMAVDDDGNPFVTEDGCAEPTCSTTWIVSGRRLK